MDAGWVPLWNKTPNRYFRFLPNPLIEIFPVHTTTRLSAPFIAIRGRRKEGRMPAGRGLSVCIKQVYIERTIGLWYNTHTRLKAKESQRLRRHFDKSLSAYFFSLCFSLFSPLAISSPFDLKPKLTLVLVSYPSLPFLSTYFTFVLVRYLPHGFLLLSTHCLLLTWPVTPLFGSFPSQRPPRDKKYTITLKALFELNATYPQYP